MKRIILLVVVLISAGTCNARPPIEVAEQYAWELSGNGTKSIECYFWVTHTEVSSVACQPLKHPTDELTIIVPSDAAYIYHTHPKGFPQPSEQDRAIERKTGIKIRVIYH